MKNIFFNTPKLKLLYSLFALQLIIFTIFRIIFLIYFSKEIAPGSFDLVFNALILGLRFDLRLVMFLLVPAIIIVNFPIKTKWKMAAIHWFYTLLITFCTILYITDAGYFAYLKSRVNATVISFLKNPLISFDMVRESYPLHWFILFTAMMALLSYWLLKRWVTPKLESWHRGTKKNQAFALGFFIFLFALFTYGSLKRYPLRWSEAFASPDSFTSNLGLNPILYIADTYSFRKADFETAKVKQYYPIVAPFLGIDQSSANYDVNKLNFVREYPENPEKLKQKPNVVIIIMESMGYYKTGLGGSAVNPTPYLDQLAKESRLFRNFYTPTVATARSIFAAVTSLPDISKVKTGSRNPFIVNQHTNIGELKNYEKYYFLGGSANWGNIRGVLSYNIPGLNIFEEGSYQSPKVDVWGISDLNLFKESIQQLNKTNQEKPFFALIQSSGFHRPYTIPSDSDKFKVLTNKDVSDQLVRDFGFESMEEYNAMRLQDYSLGRFFELAKKQKWYENTIFLIFGDHSLPHNGAKNLKDWQRNLANGFHVPLIIHSPKYVAPGEELKVASEMDVMPTVAGLTGIAYKTRSFGRDLFNPTHDNYRAAFSYNWYAPFHITLVDHEFYFEYIPGTSQGRLVKHNEPNPEENVKDRYPDKYKELEELTNGLYETAKYLLHHNQRMY